MTSLLVGRGSGILFIAALAAHGMFGAEPPSRVPPNTNSSRSAVARPGASQSQLPDPILLDGSAHPVETKSELGMIGDFELPGNENVRSGRVGGPQDPNATSSGGTGKSLPMGLPSARGGSASTSQPPPGGSPAPSSQPAANANGGQPQPDGGMPAGARDGETGGAGSPNPNGVPPGSAGDKDGQPQGIQVTELGGGAGSTDAAGGGDSGGKPRPVTIGDPKMRIESVGNSPVVVGAKPVIPDGHIQQHEKQTGTGGKPPTSPQGPGRIEKGRTMPAGL